MKEQIEIKNQECVSTIERILTNEELQTPITTNRYFISDKTAKEEMQKALCTNDENFIIRRRSQFYFFVEEEVLKFYIALYQYIKDCKDGMMGNNTPEVRLCEANWGWYQWARAVYGYNNKPEITRGEKYFHVNDTIIINIPQLNKFYLSQLNLQSRISELLTKLEELTIYENGYAAREQSITQYQSTERKMFKWDDRIYIPDVAHVFLRHPHRDFLINFIDHYELNNDNE